MERDKKKTKFLHQPQYPGGPKALNDFIYKHLRYPKAAFEHKIEGTVIVEYDINHAGEVVDARVLQRIGHGCDEEAMRVVRMLRFDVPKNRGIKATFHRKAHVRFKLPQAQPQPQANSLTVQYTTASSPTPTQPEKETPKTTYTYTINTAT